MAYRCVLCGKMGQRGNLVSHSKRRSKKVFMPNLHATHIAIDGVMRKVRLCTTCLRTAKKNLKKTIQGQVTAQSDVAIRLPKVKEPKIEIEHPKIPEAVILEMKEKSKEKKAKTGESDDMALVEEIMAESMQKDTGKKKKAKE